MPKLRNVSNDDLASLIRDMDEVHATIDNLADTIRKGYSDPIEDPVAKARALAALAKSAADLTSAILVQAGMDEMQRKLDALKSAQPSPHKD